jgi:hypothetical protein
MNYNNPLNSVGSYNRHKIEEILSEPTEIKKKAPKKTPKKSAVKKTMRSNSIELRQEPPYEDEDIEE